MRAFQGEEPEQDHEEIDACESVGPGLVQGGIFVDHGEAATEVCADVDDAVESESCSDAAHDGGGCGNRLGPREEEDHEEREEELDAIDWDGRVPGEQRCGEQGASRGYAGDDEKDCGKDGSAKCPATQAANEMVYELDGYGCLGEKVDEEEGAVE